VIEGESEEESEDERIKEKGNQVRKMKKKLS
jgi:hypothetical protein